MCKACGNASHITVNAALRYDPTRTTTLRQRFEAEMVRRFRRLARLIRERVGEEDGFGLKANAGQFDFPRSDQKVGAFMDWLQGQVSEGILEVRVGEALGRASQRAWTRPWRRAARQRQSPAPRTPPRAARPRCQPRSGARRRRCCVPLCRCASAWPHP